MKRRRRAKITRKTATTMTMLIASWVVLGRSREHIRPIHPVMVRMEPQEEEQKEIERWD